ncbi:hypothetical protein [Aureimonas sp. ME7]|uniref:hypothetical protein n=1 Tax=Aureimonas sp. ME7 TaxID=2744252 RepID=UPI0015F38FD5|nr:hypothetical protein [Aureimonas sp. ME7]
MTKTRTLASALLAAASFGTMSVAHAIVPGSDTYERARDEAAVQSVIEGASSTDRIGASPARATYGFPLATAPASAARSGGGLVPGSRSVNDAADHDAIMSVVTGALAGTYSAAPGSAGRLVPGSDSH